MDMSLPEGRRGQILATALTLAVLAAAWLGVGKPLLDWYQSGVDTLAQRQMLLRHMEALAQTLPTLEQTPAAARPESTPLLSGATDALAAAAMQNAVQAMATRAGVELASMETLPAEARGGYRRIGLRVSLTAPWPVLVELLRVASQGEPRMLVDDVQLRAMPMPGSAPAAMPVGASFTLLAFRAAGGTGS
jgi:general secretion pathway protein M